MLFLWSYPLYALDHTSMLFCNLIGQPEVSSRPPLSNYNHQPQQNCVVETHVSLHSHRSKMCCRLTLAILAISHGSLLP